MLTVGHTKIAVSSQLREPESEDAGESRRHAADEVEDSVALLEIVSGIPAGQEIGAARKETCHGLAAAQAGRLAPTSTHTCFEDTKHDTEWEHLVPHFHKAKAYHAAAPEDRDGREEYSGSNLAQNDGRRRL